MINYVKIGTLCFFLNHMTLLQAQRDERLIIKQKGTQKHTYTRPAKNLARNTVLDIKQLLKVRPIISTFYILIKNTVYL